MPRSNPAAELAQKLLTTLEQQRQPGGDYPFTVARLTALADPQAAPELVGKPPRGCGGPPPSAHPTDCSRYRR